MGGEVTAVGGNGRFVGAADEREGEIAQGGYDLRGFATAQAGVILAEGDVADAWRTSDAQRRPKERDPARIQGNNT